jgi:hypothetical protein
VATDLKSAIRKPRTFSGTPHRASPNEPPEHIARKIWQIAKRALLGFLIFILLLIGGCWAYRVYRHYELAEATAVDTEQGIDETLFTTIGGIDQWIAIRGQNRENPVRSSSMADRG